MKDLDFDELDRAVNSLIGGSTPPAAVAEPILDVPTTIPTPTISTASVPAAPVPSAPAPALVSPQPLAARRSSGRFMDVVHPSSDMRSSTPVAAVSPVSRTAPTLQPVVTPPVSSTVTPPTEPQATLKSEYPDPIDFQGFTPGATAAPTQQAAVSTEDGDDDITKIADDINASLGKESAPPLESPFIADAKVEKRPLGAFSADAAISTGVPAASPLSEPVAMLTSPVELSGAQNDDVQDHPIEKDVPLPAELQNDLLSIEANENPSPVAEATFTPPAPSTDVSAGPSSIPQQYTESPSTSDRPVPTMFATEAYKKPTAHTKKRAGWLIVLWIALLIIVGGGIGAAVYFFVLPRL